MADMTERVDPDQLAEAPPDLRRHPIRAFFWALPLGIGLALVLIVTKVITLAILPIALTVGFVIVLAVLWGSFGPAKAPTGPRPVVVIPGSVTDTASPEPAAPPEPAEPSVWPPAPDAPAPPTTGQADAGGSSFEPPTDSAPESGERPPG